MKLPERKYFRQKYPRYSKSIETYAQKEQNDGQHRLILRESTGLVGEDGLRKVGPSVNTEGDAAAGSSEHGANDQLPFSDEFDDESG